MELPGYDCSAAAQVLPHDGTHMLHFYTGAARVSRVYSTVQPKLAGGLEGNFVELT
jgi:hypothetical protein